jgi:succinate dehydrogenase / fumarate reductase iron-sulfur subunit
LVPKHDADGAFDAATCGVVDLCCSCKTHQLCYLYLLRGISICFYCHQGKVEAADRVMNMVAQMDAEVLVTVPILGNAKLNVKGISLENVPE